MAENSSSKTMIKNGTILLVLSLLLVVFSQDFFFFWDNIIQLAVPANYYYDTHFSTLYLPDAITTGHQPFTGMYLALGWKIFGRSIEISHWLIWPFIFGVFWQLFRLVSLFLRSQRDRWICFAAVILESVILTQLTLLTFEIFHIFFFLATLNALLRKEKLWTTLFFSGLMMVSLRATMSGIGIVAFVFLRQIFIDRKFRLSQYWVFVPGFLLFALFLFSFYEARGWIIHNTVSKSWEKSAQYADAFGMLKNSFFFFWRIFDLGKIIYLLLLVYIIIKSIKTKTLDRNFLLISLIAFGQFLIFFVTTIPYQNSIGHRYVLPVTLPMTMGIVYWFLVHEKENRYFVWSIFGYLFVGYIWVYPLRVAKSWDSMPLHWTYYDVWRDMKNYVDAQRIAPANIKTFFPNTATFRNTALLNDDREYGIGDAGEQYVLFSNVYNESDETIDELFNSGKFIPIHSVEKGDVYMILFKKRP